MRVKFTQNITDHARGLDGFGGRRQTHFVHGVQNAPLYGFLPIGDIGQGAPFDHGNCVV